MDLSTLLTPALYDNILKNRMSWPRDTPLDFHYVANYLFRGQPGEPEVAEQFYNMTFPVLKVMSTIPLADFPDLFSYLPEPSSEQFPLQALGLQLLIDQGPRQDFEGADERWKYDFFDKISQKYARQLLALPAHVNPYSKTRWLGDLGASFDYWLLARLWFQAPLQHSEVLSDHDDAAEINEEMRCEVEHRTDTTDPNREDRENILKDVYAYPRTLTEGPPTHEGYTMEEFAYWMLTLMDVHRCIVVEYESYPQRYAARGREATEKEKKYLERTGHFDEIDADEARKVRGDTANGVWRSLQGRGDTHHLP